MWTRRRFLGSAALAGGLSAWPELAAGLSPLPQDALPPPRSQGSSPEITAGKVVPLLESNVARPLRYRPEAGGFSIQDGREFFNRPLYGPNIPFRADGGDRPEFSLYLPGHGGNLRLGVATTDNLAGKWLIDFESILAQYAGGRLLYELRDPLLGGRGLLRLEALTCGAGLWLTMEGSGLPEGLAMTWGFGGVSGRKGQRNGDIGCEVEPVGLFFQMRPEECSGNRWTLPNPAASPSEPQAAEVQAGKIRLRIQGPQGAELRLGEAMKWNETWPALWPVDSEKPLDNPAKTPLSPLLPILLGRVALRGEPLLLRLDVLDGTLLPTGSEAAAPAAAAMQAFAARRAELASIAGAVHWSTPDAFLDGTAGALGIAADAIWDEAQGCVMHGAVAWRMPLAGWRGPYALYALGRHDRMRRNLRHWISRQNRSAVLNGSGGSPGEHGFEGIAEARGSPDPGSRGARSEALLHSAGDLSHNHYDMNLVFFDALLRHLRWTGDLQFAAEVWPALELHAAWERRLFRRDYASGPKPLPLYEAYAAIWASDNLQYNGGGAAHSSAYNFFLNREMSALAKRLGKPNEVVAAYASEAEAIRRAMRQVLWMPERGAFAESREWLGERRLGESPAVWTMYQAIDSEVPDAKQAWQMAADRLRVLRKIPIRGSGVPDDAGWQIACSDWQPYVWSLTLVVLGENLATALALFQCGMADQAYDLLHGSLLDAGYRGLCPGNFPMSLQLDPHRQESQRDFGDPIGCAARVLIEGLWGVQPDLLRGQLTLRPQLPLAWTEAQIHHPELQLDFERKGSRETWRIVTFFARPVGLTLELRGRTVGLPKVLVNRRTTPARFAADAVGEPRLIVNLPATASGWDIEVEWRGAEPIHVPQDPLACTVGAPVSWPAGVQSSAIDDPQGCLRGMLPQRAGSHTVFALQQTAGCRFWLPLELRIAEPVSAAESRRASAEPPASFDPIPLEPLLDGGLNDIFTRGYHAPRSGLCSLNLPDGLLGGWANFDVHASIDDSGLRKPGGMLHLPGGPRFRTVSGAGAPNCCFLSQWAQDRNRIQVPLHGRARSLYVLLAGTTFPQATRSRHATLQVLYRDGPPGTAELSSPETWWPVEQDYLVDDFVFRLTPTGDPEHPLPWRVDLRSGQARRLNRKGLLANGGPVPGGAAFVAEMKLDSSRELEALAVHVELYGVVLALIAVTLGR